MFSLFVVFMCFSDPPDTPEKIPEKYSKLFAREDELKQKIRQATEAEIKDPRKIQGNPNRAQLKEYLERSRKRLKNLDSEPIAPQISMNLDVGDLGQLDRVGVTYSRVGDGVRARVLSVDGQKGAIVDIMFQSLRFQGPPTEVPAYVTGADTSKWKDGDVLDLPGMWECVGTHNYIDTLNGKRTIAKLHPANMQEINKYRSVWDEELKNKSKTKPKSPAK